MKKKILLLFLASIVLTSCGTSASNYVRCNRINIDNKGYIDNSEPRRFVFAKYLADAPIESYSTVSYGDDHKTIYAMMPYEDYNSKGFKEDASISFYNYSQERQTVNGKFVSLIVATVSSKEIYYSSSIRTVKTIEKNYYPETIYNQSLLNELKNKKYYGASTSQNQTIITTDGPSYYEYFNSNKTETYTDLGSTLITYILY